MPLLDGIRLMNLQSFKDSFWGSVQKLREPFKDSSIGIVVLIFFIVPLIFSLFGIENFTTIKLTSFLLGNLIFVFILLSKSDFTVQGNRWFLLSMALLLFGTLASFLIAPDHYLATFGQYRRYTGSLLFLVSWVLLMFGMTAKGFGWYGIRYVFIASLLASLLNSVYGFFQSFGIGYYIPLVSEGFVRVPGFIGNANFTAMYIVSLVPIGIVFAYKATSKVGRIFYSTVVLTGIASLSVFSSRGASLGLVIGLGVAVVLAGLSLRKNMKLVGMLLLSAVPLVVISYLFFASVRVGSLSSNETNVGSRILVWEKAADIFIENPVFGVGLGNFENSFISQRENYLGSRDFYYDDAHNLFVQVAVEGGIVLLIGFLGLISITLWRTLRAYLLTKDEWLLALISGLIVFVVTACFTPVEVVNWVLLAGILAGMWVRTSENYIDVQLKFILRVLIRVVVIGFALYGVLVAVAEPFMELSGSYFGNRNFEKAYSYGLIASRLSPFNPFAHTAYLGSSLQLGVPIEEVRTKTAYYGSLHPTNYRVAANTGIMYFKIFRITNEKQDLEKSLRYLKLAQSLNPQDRGPSQVMANIYFLNGNLEEAKKITIGNLTISQNRSQLFDDWGLMSRIYSDEKRYREMLFALDRVYKLNIYNSQLKWFLINVRKEKDLSKVEIPIGFDPLFFN